MKWLVALAFAGISLSTPVLAEVDEQEIALLREQIRMLTERLDQLEQSSRQGSPSQPSEPVTSESSEESIAEVVNRQLDERLAGSWTERLSWKGDFRYRYESIDVEGQNGRNRQRIRARALLAAKISDDMRVGLGLASGGDDPVSTNQTLGGGGSTKDINLDLAYFEWSPGASTRVVGGKFKNLLHRAGGNGLLWDSDWNPEGLALAWDNGNYFAQGIGTWVESDSGTRNQEFVYGLQSGLNFELASGVELLAGAGYYRFDTAGHSSFFGDDDDFFGNSYDPDTLRYLYNYHELEAFAELHFDFLGRPSSVFGNYVVNLDADEKDTGYAFGMTSGSTKAPGDWKFGVTWQELEADAVLGLLTDSDFGGGGTNARGFILNGAYAFHKSWNASFTYFINDIDIDAPSTRDFDRLQLDINFKY